MKKTFPFALIAVLLAAGSVLAGPSLDNSAWQATEKGQKTAKDHLLFINGQFVSSGCVPYGFTTSAYAVQSEGSKAQWSATQTNAENEKMVWKGQTNGDTMTGTYVYTDKAGKTWTQEWSATKITKH